LPIKRDTRRAKPHAQSAAARARGLVRIAQQQRERARAGAIIAEGQETLWDAESAICEPRHQPDAVSYVCQQQFTLGPTQVQISWFIGRVHASVNSKFAMPARRRFALN
jgi:hypothetical protein